MLEACRFQLPTRSLSRSSLCSSSSSRSSDSDDSAYASSCLENGLDLFPNTAGQLYSPHHATSARLSPNQYAEREEHLGETQRRRVKAKRRTSATTAGTRALSGDLSMEEREERRKGKVFADEIGLQTGTMTRTPSWNWKTLSYGTSTDNSSVDSSMPTGNELLTPPEGNSDVGHAIWTGRVDQAAPTDIIWGDPRRKGNVDGYSWKEPRYSHDGQAREEDDELVCHRRENEGAYLSQPLAESSNSQDRFKLLIEAFSGDGDPQTQQNRSNTVGKSTEKSPSQKLGTRDGLIQSQSLSNLLARHQERPIYPPPPPPRQLRSMQSLTFSPKSDPRRPSEVKGARSIARPSPVAVKRALLPVPLGTTSPTIPGSRPDSMSYHSPSPSSLSIMSPKSTTRYSTLSPTTIPVSPPTASSLGRRSNYSKSQHHARSLYDDDSSNWDAGRKYWEKAGPLSPSVAEEFNPWNQFPESPGGYESPWTGEKSHFSPPGSICTDFESSEAEKGVKKKKRANRVSQFVGKILLTMGGGSSIHPLPDRPLVPKRSYT